LPTAGEDGKLDLAQIGANARRATENSSSIAYLAAPNPAANRFSGPILEEADIPQLTNPSGATAISRLLRALEEPEESISLRESVSESLK
jgi:hypothetical protein